jgi:hypothetical protein
MKKPHTLLFSSLMLLFITAVNLSHAEEEKEIKNIFTRPVVIKALDTTGYNILQIFPDQITKLDYNNAIFILKQMPPKYGVAVTRIGQTAVLKTERSSTPLPLRAKVEVNKWEMIVTFLLYQNNGTIEARTVRFDHARAGDYLVKFNNQSFAVFCSFGD